MLAVMLLLRCALVATLAEELVDGTWFRANDGDRGKSVLSDEDISGHHHADRAHVHYMTDDKPSWYNHPSKNRIPVFYSQVEGLSNRFVNKPTERQLNPSTGAVYQKQSDRRFFAPHAKAQSKRDSFDRSPPTPTCGRLQEYLCWGMNHPHCIVKYPGQWSDTRAVLIGPDTERYDNETTLITDHSAPASTLSPSLCRVQVRCNYTSDFDSSQTLCFAGRKAFPAPLLQGVDQLNLRYSYTLKLYGSGHSPISIYTGYNASITAVQAIDTAIHSLAGSGLSSFLVSTDYLCAHMTPCEFTAPHPDTDLL